MKKTFDTILMKASAKYPEMMLLDEWKHKQWQMYVVEKPNEDDHGDRLGRGETEGMGNEFETSTHVEDLGKDNTPLIANTIAVTEAET